MSTIGIHKIKEDEFTFKPHNLTVIVPEKLSLSNSIAFAWDLDQNEFHLTFIVQYYYEIEEEQAELVKFSTTTNYYVSDLDKLLVVADTSFELPDDLILTFVSTSIATARGMLTYKLTGTLLADYYLPLINPKSFLENTKGVSMNTSKKKPKNVN